ncbi:MAG TPA: hypothetical protein VHE35_10140 [Kofleriaceae bacterium]|nr:hypothetical protein [Kofleriaceae bacterium]
MKVRYLLEAEADYAAAAAWYDEHSPDAGDDFVEAIEKAEATIAAFPPRVAAVAGRPQRDAPPSGAGDALRDRLPIRDDEIEVFAVAHQRRSPRYWFGRHE